MENKSTRNSGGSGRALKSVFGAIGRFIATLVMVGVITGCIVACVMTVYVFNYIGAEDEINLDQEELGYTSVMLYYDKETEKYEELQKLYIPDNNRIWVNYDEISQYVKDAVIATEDKRFEKHQGVDWRRTFGAFLWQFGIGNASGGGSTITQQLIKNITGDDDWRIDRKVREIFRALELEKKYTKEKILESYLNVVPFGAGTNGIQSASLTYFGKNASDLTLAEAASIVGITKFPTRYNPFLYPEKNKARQEDVLTFMYKEGKITEKEYEAALVAPLNFKREEYQQQQTQNIMSYYEDYVFTTVVKDLMAEKNWTENYAREQLYSGGYQIYTCVDPEIQDYLEKFYLTTEGFPAISNAEYPQSCANIIDHNGKLLATVGGIGEKTGNLVFNRATRATRQPGSSIKPIGTYALAFEYNKVDWSYVIEDGPINMAKAGQPENWWPTNYYAGYKGPITVATAVQLSVNTVAVKLVDNLTPRTVFDFLHDRLNLYSLVEEEYINGAKHSDISLAPMALGATTHGVTPLEMVGAYQIFANGGTFTAPYCYTEVRDSAGRVILEADTAPRHVISEDTAVLMNKLLQTVNTVGTGTKASLGQRMPTAGKTGTSDDDVNQWYIGMTPYYICQVWLGYDEETRINEYGKVVPHTIYYSGLTYPPPVLWKSIMEPLHEGLETKQFLDSENVVSKTYCQLTGKLAVEGCPGAVGWYRTSRIPGSCTGHVTQEEESGSGDDNGDGAERARIGTGDSNSTRAEQIRDDIPVDVIRIVDED